MRLQVSARTCCREFEMLVEELFRQTRTKCGAGVLGVFGLSGLPWVADDTN